MLKRLRHVVFSIKQYFITGFQLTGKNEAAYNIPMTVNKIYITRKT